MAHLQRVWNSHQRIQFPPDDADPELSAVHADLVLYDDRVAGAVAALLGRGRVNRNALKENTALRGRVEGIVALGDERRKRAERYLDYIEHIEALLNTARELTEPTRTQN